jgi:hypothetical protein
MKLLLICIYIYVCVCVCLVLVYFFKNKITKKNKTVKYKRKTNLPVRFNRPRDTVNLNLELHFDDNDINYIPHQLLQPQIESYYIQPHPLEINQLQELFNQPLEPAFDRDSQNVHDSFIQNYTSKKYNDYNGIDTENITNLKQDILHFASNNSKKNDLQNVLDQIESRNSSLTKFNDDCEMDILQKTWENGNDIIKAQIINELLDCKNGHDIYCPTGVATRIVNANFIEEPEKMAKTKEIFHQEMMNTASTLRTEMENDESYNNLSPDTQTETFKINLIKKYTQDYKDIIKPEEIIEMTGDWIDYI